MLSFGLFHPPLPVASTFGDFIRRWDPSPVVLIPLTAIALAYLFGLWRLRQRARYAPVSSGRVTLFVAGFLTLLLALVSPIGVYGDDLFFMHMLQHMLLMMVAAPLLLLAGPMAVYLWCLPSGPRHLIGRMLSRSGVIRVLLQGLTLPVVAWLLYAGSIWVWHIPVLYDAALDSSPVHYMEHLIMFGAAVLFWWPVIGAPPLRSHLPYHLRLLYLFLALFQNIVVAAIITFADIGLYGHYAARPRHWGISVNYDQQIAGIIMWLKGSMMYLTALAIVFFAWMEGEERRTARWEADQERRRRYMEETRPTAGSIRQQE